jgi:energy-converting hydrogenase Eha subunit A
MFTLTNVRNTTGIVILFGHMMCSLLLIVFWLRGGYTFDEMVNIFALIAPMFAAYLSLIVNFAFRPPISDPRKPLSELATVFSLVFPISFISLMALAITLKAFNAGLYRMEDLVKFIGIIETVMGGYTASVVKNLFASGRR